MASKRLDGLELDLVGLAVRLDLEVLARKLCNSMVHTSRVGRSLFSGSECVQLICKLGNWTNWGSDALGCLFAWRPAMFVTGVGRGKG